MIRLIGAAAAILGLVMMVFAAATFSVSPFSALFMGGIGAILLGAGGVAQVNLPGAAIVGSAGFVMMVIAAIAPHIP